MLRKSVIAAAALMLLVSCVCVASADSVGVKRGDWIEYNVSYTGSPAQGHDVTWARMEILDVLGSNISVSITSQFGHGTTDTMNYTLNLQTGHLIDNFIVPANLKFGDSFPDENFGTVNITDAQIRQYAGAYRTVLSASVGNNTYVWDQATGVSIESASQTDTYSIHTLVAATNMWQPTPPQPKLDLTIWVLIGAVFVIFVALLFAFTAWYLKRKACQRRTQHT